MTSDVVEALAADANIVLEHALAKEAGEALGARLNLAVLKDQAVNLVKNPLLQVGDAVSPSVLWTGIGLGAMQADNGASFLSAAKPHDGSLKES